MIEGVLPTLLRDIERFKLLRDTLRVHAGDMHRCIVVVPDHEIDAFRNVIGDDIFYDLRSEGAVLGRRLPKYVMDWKKWRPRRAGWYIQQLVKLACVAQSTSDYCMTLDSDLIAVNDISGDLLLREGRAVVQVTDCGDEHDAWYRGSSRILGSGMSRTGIEYPVTPSLLCPVACRRLIQHLVGRVRPLIECDWIDMLLKRAPWSEYTLYFTYLERTGNFEQFHVIINEPIVYDPYASLWRNAQIGTWDPSRRHPKSIFLIAQSTTTIETDTVRKLLLRAPAQ